jgi:hypothetical protein
VLEQRGHRLLGRLEVATEVVALRGAEPQRIGELVMRVPLRIVQQARKYASAELKAEVNLALRPASRFNRASSSRSARDSISGAPRFRCETMSNRSSSRGARRRCASISRPTDR